MLQSPFCRGFFVGVAVNASFSGFLQFIEASGLTFNGFAKCLIFKGKIRKNFYRIASKPLISLKKTCFNPL